MPPAWLEPHAWPAGMQEYDVAEQGLSRQERVARQRKSLKSKLGLGGPVDLMDTSELVKDEDLVTDSGAAARKEPGKAAQKDASALLSEMTGPRWQILKLLLLERCSMYPARDEMLQHAMGEDALRQIGACRPERAREEPAEAQAQAAGCGGCGRPQPGQAYQS